MTWLDLLALVAAGAAAGLINTVVGSGTLITFPTLLALGVPPVTANISNTVGLAPGSLSGAWATRDGLSGQRRRVLWLGAASLLGGIAGALLLLWLAGIDLNISSAMGLILLVGLVVKNGIMLLDFSEKLHAAGEPFDVAIAHAGRIRLRPILMTTFCTLFGLLPLALGLGAGAELQKPLALAVIGGLALSTPVTLLAIPGLYAAIKGWQA